jgi:CheY-like chemotaxis protein
MMGRMSRLRLFHWKAAQAAPLIAALKAAGHSVEYREEAASYRDARDSPPDMIVIDLSLRPSHGREVAIVLRAHKATRHVPIVFVGGDPEKVEVVRRFLPDATYTSPNRLIATLRRVKPLADPVLPPRMMDRYAGRSTAQKLGIGKGAAVAVVDPPADYARAIGKLPEGAWFEEDSTEDCKLTLWFAHDPAGFQAALPEMRRVAAKSRLWILWPKGKKDGLNGNIVREGCVDVGLVDYKICSVNETWSAMVFAVKKTC